MPRRLFIFGLVLLTAARLRAGDLLDRIVANVNGHVILQSDWDDEVRYESFMAEHALQAIKTEDRKAALDRLVEQELLNEQARTVEFTPATAEEIEKQLQQMKSDRSQGKGADAWRTDLSSHDLTEEEIRNRLALELNQLRMVDARLRPSIQVDTAAIHDYYNQQFLPQLQRAGAQPITLQEATPKIRELLLQQKMNEALSSWLESLRSQAQIHVFANPSETGQAP